MSGITGPSFLSQTQSAGVRPRFLPPATEVSDTDRHADGVALSPQAQQLLAEPEAPSTDLTGLTRELHDLGVEWDGQLGGLSPQQARSTLEALRETAKRLPADKRPNVHLRFDNDPNPPAAGQYTHANRTVHLYTKDLPSGDEGSLTQVALHEYGHGVAFKNQAGAEELGGDHVTDRNGGDLYKAAKALGPGHDPYVHSHTHPTAEKPSPEARDVTARFLRSKGVAAHDISQILKGIPFQDKARILKAHGVTLEDWMHFRDSGGPGGSPVLFERAGHEEKYAAVHPDEHYAETFREYTSHPERFQQQIADTRKHLSTLPSHSPEAAKVKEELRILEESYAYFDRLFKGGGTH